MTAGELIAASRVKADGAKVIVTSFEHDASGRLLQYVTLVLPTIPAYQAEQLAEDMKKLLAATYNEGLIQGGRQMLEKVVFERGST